jgi:predicted RNA-binding protein YlxR (DUF448 family)
LPKKALIRIVRSAEGVKVDLTGKAPGRGAYIHGQRCCWDKALKGPVAHALKTEPCRKKMSRVLYQKHKLFRKRRNNEELSMNL